MTLASPLNQQQQCHKQEHSIQYVKNRRLFIIKRHPCDNNVNLYTKASHWSEYTFMTPSIWQTLVFFFALLIRDEYVCLQRSVKIPLHADFALLSYKRQKDYLITATYTPHDGSHSEKLSLHLETTTESKLINN